MKQSESNIVVVDLGGTKILSAILNEEAKIISTAKKSTRSKDNNQDIFDRIISTIEESLNNVDLNINSIEGIVLGVPGSLNPETGFVNLAPNLGWKDMNIVEPLQNHFNKKVIIENDANLGTLGIYHFEKKSECENLIAIFVGTGIGAGIIINGKLFRGKNFSAGEIGHMKIVVDGEKCGCGNYGCLETEASRTAIARIINKEIKKGKKSIITKLIPDGRTRKVIKSSILAEALSKKDKVTIKAVEYASKKLGIATANIINLLDIDCIVFAGGVMEAIGEYMLPIIKEEVEKVALKSNLKNTQLVLSTLKDDSAVLGGFALFHNL